MIRLNDPLLCSVLPDLFSKTEGMPVLCEHAAQDSIRRTAGGFRIRYTSRPVLHRQLGAVLAGVSPGTPAEPAFSERGLMFDCSRGAVPSIPFLKRTAARLSLLGLTHLALYTEDTFEVTDMPFIGFGRGRYSKDEIRELDDFCFELGIELFPCIQTLGHLEHIFKNPRFKQFSDAPRILNVNSPEAAEFIEHLILEASSPYRSKRIHLGADEPWGLGLGTSLDFNAPVPPKQLYLRHLANLAEICKRHGLTGMIWSDYILGHSRNIPLDDAELRRISSTLTLDYWNYVSLSEEEHTQNIRRLQKTGCPLWISPGLRSWNRFFGDFPAAAETGSLFYRTAARNGVRSALTTLWGDDGAESLFCTNFAAAAHHLLCMADPENSLETTSRYVAAIGGFPLKRYGLFAQMDNTASLHNIAENPNWSMCKQLFYDDPLSGFLLRLADSEQLFTQLEEVESAMRELRSLSPADRDLRRFGMLFAKALRWKLTASALALNGWQTKNPVQLKRAGRTSRDAAQAVREFGKWYETLWLAERKPFGLEIPQARIAGVAARLDYLAGRIHRHLKSREPIPELDQPLSAGFTTRDAGTAYASAASKSHNTIWMM